MAKKTQPATDLLDALLVDEYEVQGKRRSNWSKIGAAWPHQDGEVYRLVLNALPVNGVVVLRLNARHASGALRERYRLRAQILAGLALAWVLTLGRLSM